MHSAGLLIKKTSLVIFARERERVTVFLCVFPRRAVRAGLFSPRCGTIARGDDGCEPAVNELSMNTGRGTKTPRRPFNYREVFASAFTVPTARCIGGEKLRGSPAVVWFMSL